MAWRRYGSKEVVPFVVMVVAECAFVWEHTLFKAASLQGLSYYVYIAYSFAIAAILLMPPAFLSYRSTMLPPPEISVLCKIIVLGGIGFLNQILANKGLVYGSPTLASVISNLSPAFTFILAIIFRMEKLSAKSKSGRAKVIGTLVSVAGALIVVLYTGPPLTSPSSSPSNAVEEAPVFLGADSDRVLSGILLAGDVFLRSLWAVALAHVVRQYPSELVVVFLYNLSLTAVCAPICFLLEPNLEKWKLKADITLLAVLYAGIFAHTFGVGIHTWALHVKGPVYVSLFKPLSIPIAALLGFIFLGGTLYLGCIVGSVVISVGFYAVTWGKAKEEKVEDYLAISSLESSSPVTTPLLG
ncbi:hypothetical protein NMG60_11006588 [Bertholletia excelsa]